MYEDAAEITGRRVGTLQQYSKIALAKKSESRTQNPPFKHHPIAASLSEDIRGDVLHGAAMATDNRFARSLAPIGFGM